MSGRIIRGTDWPRDLIELLLVEVSCPSTQVYLTVESFTDPVVLDNRERHYSALFPLIEKPLLRLSDLLWTLAWKGCRVCLLGQEEDEALRQLLSRPGMKAEVRKKEAHWENALLTSGFYSADRLDGGYSVTTDPSEVEQAWREMDDRWEQAETLRR